MSTYLRTRYRALHSRFGTAGMVIAVIALIAALSGTALAAKGALTGKQKKEVEKIAKKFAGKPGAPGTAGANGTNGTNGKDGAPGAPGADGNDGAPGAPGDDGDPGADGKSVEVAAELQAGEPGCDENGGVVYEVKDSGVETEVCNGKEGKDGSPWSDGGTLPNGATETGNWALNGTAGNTGGVYVPISFPVPLALPIEEAAEEVFYVTAAQQGANTKPPQCPGNINEPKALEGALCIYESPQFEVVNATFDSVYQAFSSEIKGASRSGALLHFSAVGDGAYGAGTWAVTAP